VDIAQTHIGALNVGPIASVVCNGETRPRLAEWAVPECAVGPLVAGVTRAGVILVDYAFPPAVFGVFLVLARDSAHQSELTEKYDHKYDQRRHCDE
jgi:hypothetical protein